MVADLPRPTSIADFNRYKRLIDRPAWFLEDDDCAFVNRLESEEFKWLGEGAGRCVWQVNLRGHDLRVIKRLAWDEVDGSGYDGDVQNIVEARAYVKAQQVDMPADLIQYVPAVIAWDSDGYWLEMEYLRPATTRADVRLLPKKVLRRELAVALDLRKNEVYPVRQWGFDVYGRPKLVDMGLNARSNKDVVKELAKSGREDRVKERCP